MTNPNNPAEGVPAEQILPSGKAKAPFFAAVRQRGILNTILRAPEEIYLEKHPDQSVKWEYFPTNGDNTMVVARESMGYRLVDASEVATTESSQKSGLIRRGDLVMMACPKELADEIAAQDARAAFEDLRAPEQAFYDAVDKKKVASRSGEELGATPFGNIKVATEVKQAAVKESGEITVNLE